MAMEEIIDLSKTISGAVVKVSSYQVVQDTQIFDLLEPKDQEVLILEDAQRRTHLKGLSKVQKSLLLSYSALPKNTNREWKIRHILPLWMPHTQLVCILDNHLILIESFPSQIHVKSVEDFAHLSCFDSNRQNKQSTKASTQVDTRGHQGVIIHISRVDQGGTECAIAKMNFLNLTGLLFLLMPAPDCLFDMVCNIFWSLHQAM
jgi:kinesin family protein 22